MGPKCWVLLYFRKFIENSKKISFVHLKVKIKKTNKIDNYQQRKET